MITRKEFLQTLAGASAIAALPSANVAAGLPRHLPANSAPAPASATKAKRGVSLYCYQESFYTRTMTLEDCIAEVSSIGAYGIEMLAEEMVPDFPNPSNQWVDQWHALMDKYGTVPDTYTQFQNTYIRKNYELTVDEGVAMLETDFKLAKRLGFTHMRMLIGTPLDVLEKSLPLAEKYDIWMGSEVHAPSSLDSKLVHKWIEIIDRTKTKHWGLNPDFGIFQSRPNKVQRDRMIRDGELQESIGVYIDHAWTDGVPRDKAAEEIKKMGAKKGDNGYLDTVYSIRKGDPKLMAQFMPYIRHCHGKFWEMTENYEERSIPYEEIIPVLVNGGFDGYVASEYEGQRYAQDVCGSDDLEQVRRQHVMFKRLGMA
jgi:Xylose isomerase-like TIM barrel